MSANVPIITETATKMPTVLILRGPIHVLVIKVSQEMDTTVQIC